MPMCASQIDSHMRKHKPLLQWSTTSSWGSVTWMESIPKWQWARSSASFKKRPLIQYCASYHLFHLPRDLSLLTAPPFNHSLSTNCSKSSVFNTFKPLHIRVSPSLPSSSSNCLIFTLPFTNILLKKAVYTRYLPLPLFLLTPQLGTSGFIPRCLTVSVCAKVTNSTLSENPMGIFQFLSYLTSM